MARARWEHWLEEARSWAPDQVDWEELELFLEEMRTLRERRIHESRILRMKKQLALRLETMQQERALLLTYLRLTFPATDSIFQLPEADILALGERAMLLESNLQSIANLRERSCATFDEEERRTEEIRPLRRAVQDHLTALHAALSARPPSSMPAPDPAAAPPAATVSMAPSTEAEPSFSMAPSAPPNAPVCADDIPEPPAPAAVPEPDPAPPMTAPPIAAQVQMDAPPPPTPAAPARPSTQAPAPANEPACPGPLSSQPETLASRSDEDLRGMLIELLDLPSPPPPLAALLVEQQRRWLQRGQNLRGYLAARHFEDALLGADSPPLPAWLCWLAVLLSDPHAGRLEFQARDFAPHLYQLCEAAHEPFAQRFLLCWLSAALLGPQSSRAVQLAVHLRPGLWEPDWAHKDLFFFCRRFLLEPAQRGRQPCGRSLDTPEALRARSEERITKAGEIMTLSNNYQNSLVKHFWIHLVGRGGPVRAILDQARQDTLPDPLPSTDEVASRVPNWDQIQADYRRNITRRLGTFLDALGEVLVLQRQARQLRMAAASQVIIPPDEAAQALQQAPALLSQIERDGCLSLAALQLLHDRLQLCAEERP